MANYYTVKYIRRGDLQEFTHEMHQKVWAMFNDGTIDVKEAQRMDDLLSAFYTFIDDNEVEATF